MFFFPCSVEEGVTEQLGGHLGSVGINAHKRCNCGNRHGRRTTCFAVYQNFFINASRTDLLSPPESSSEIQVGICKAAKVVSSEPQLQSYPSDFAESSLEKRGESW